MSVLPLFYQAVADFSVSLPLPVNRFSGQVGDTSLEPSSATFQRRYDCPSPVGGRSRDALPNTISWIALNSRFSILRVSL